MKSYKRFINFTLVIILLFFPVTLSQSKTIPDSFADLAEKLMPSVVNISTTQTIKTTSNPFPFQFPPGSPFEDMFKEFRAKGAEMAVTITSTADKEVTVLLANAKKQSEIMKGEGDGQRNKIFAQAFGKDPEFFAFYRAMIAYEKALIGGDTSLILSPDSDFFKFFGDTGVIKKQ